MNVELMAPAGGEQALIAAVQNGADAVYFGGQSFNARAGAENFPSIAAVTEYCHLRGVKAYCTLNTLVRLDEFTELDALLLEAAQAGVDALIVQDIAVAARTKAILPDIPLHMSTQAGVMGRYGALYAKDFGFERVVAARECTLEDYHAMADTGIGVEAFVQGALCVCYSGRCLMSSMIGGRSGNRGRCAQPCRLQYSVDGREGYLLSPRDLCLLEDIPALLAHGVRALKIEGRMRRPEYVAIATAAYRRALDAALSGSAYDAAKDREDLLAVFCRGAYTKGWAFGHSGKEFYYSERPNHTGVPVGNAIADGFFMLDVPLCAGDSLEGRPSGTGFQAREDAQRGAHPSLYAKAGDILYRTGDTALLESAKQTYSAERRTHHVSAVLTIHPGEPASLALDDIIAYGAVAQAAQNRPLSYDEARKQIDRFGREPLELDTFELKGEAAFLPVSALNSLRREAVAVWKQSRLLATRLYDAPSGQFPPYAPPEGQPFAQEKPMLIAQTGNLALIDEMRETADQVYYRPADVREEPLGRAMDSLLPGDGIVLPFWLEGDELFKAAERAKELGLVVVAGSFAALRAAENGCIGDLTLNAFSPLGAQALMESGCMRVTLSPELTLRQMEPIAKACPCEAVVHGAIPLMTLRHCPLRAFHAGGKGAAECSLCKEEGYSLTDRKGESFPARRVRAQNGCRIEILNAHTLDMLDYTHRLRAAGLRALRVITDDIGVLRAYANNMSGGNAALTLQKRTRGHYDRGVE